MSEITTHYVTLPDGGGQIHYRKAGSGPPLIILHPSPQDSRAMAPALAAFGEICTCYALDTPGYGLSDDVVGSDPDLGSYAKTILATADALGLGQFYLYGAATGAQVAIEMGKRFPERIALTLLDSNGHLEPEERDRLAEGYFPDVTPRRDGGHLLTWWDMSAGVFTSFPWQSDDPAHRLPIDRLPAEVVKALLVRYLDAGQDYAKAYALAFAAETIDHLRTIKTPATMMRWEGSVVLEMGDAMIAQGLPDHVEVLRAGPAPSERYRLQVEALQKAIGANDLAGQSDLKPDGPEVSGPERIYLPTKAGPLHARINRSGNGPALVFLHAAGGSHRSWGEALRGLDGKRPTLAIDLPGHGHSPRSDAEETFDPAVLARQVSEAIASAGIGRVELVGEGLGAAVALALADETDAAMVHIVDPIPLTQAERSAFTAKGIPDLTPKHSGAHLLEAWHYLRSKARYWPWFDGSVASQRDVLGNLDPDILHEQLADLMRAGDSLVPALTAEHSIDWQELLDRSQVPHRLVITERYPVIKRVEEWANVQQVTSLSSALLHS